ncbi:GrpB family protein [Lysinibacillus sp. NPDC059133]|uniref:GrpB family protein n=1 Tax=Lysinibacillus sp. NPDC059133 TaxID=3346737 RepID=UPI0036BD1D0F
MILGLKKNEVKIVPYDSEWKNEFMRACSEIKEHTNIQLDRIQHIGSTSIDGIQAKPIIDILMGFEDIDHISDSFLKAMKKADFYRLRVERPAEIVFAKFTDDTFEIKTHFVHLVNYQGEKWCDLLFFRDYLNANEEAKRQYEKLKLKFLNSNLQGVEEYTSYKEQFVQSVFDKRIALAGDE